MLRRVVVSCLLCLALSSTADAFSGFGASFVRGVGSPNPSAHVSRAGHDALAGRRGASATTSLRMSDGVGFRQKGKLYENPGAVFCPCGSGKSYEECCFPSHKQNKPPRDPEDLIKTRYSAFACNLPRYIISTTDKNSNEWQPDEDTWEREIIDFMDRYQFQEPDGDAMGVFVENCKFFNPEVAYVQFKARMLGEGGDLIEFVERSRVEKKGSRWYYVQGTLLEHHGPML